MRDRALKKLVHLDTLCTEWSSLEKIKERFYRQRLHHRDIGTGTIQTLYLMQVRIDYLVRQIVRDVEWFIHNDMNIDNEVAMNVFNTYGFSIRHGLSTLIGV